MRHAHMHYLKKAEFVRQQQLRRCVRGPRAAGAGKQGQQPGSQYSQHQKQKNSSSSSSSRRARSQPRHNTSGSEQVIRPAAQEQWAKAQDQQQPLPEQQLLFQQQQQQQQQLGYVPEPWEVAVPCEVSEPWQLPAEPWQQQQQQQQQPAGSPGPAPAGNPVLLQGAAGGGAWSGVNQLVLDGVYDIDEQEEGEEEGEEDAGVWLIADGGSFSADEGAGAAGAVGSPQAALRPPPDTPRPSLTPSPSPPALGAPSAGSSSSSSAVAPGPDLAAEWSAAASVALGLLASYDVRRDVLRCPPSARSSRGSAAPIRVTPTGVAGAAPAAAAAADISNVSLTAAAAAARARARVRQHSRQVQQVQPASSSLLQQAEGPATPQELSSSSSSSSRQQEAGVTVVLRQQTPPQQQQQQQQSGVPLLPDDPRWQQVQATHAAYRSYMQQLSELVVSQAQQAHQLVHQQVGICEHWLQLSHMLSVFGGPTMSPALPSAMWKRLAAIINRKVFVRMSSTERVHYDLFIESLVQQTITSLQQHNTGSGSSSKHTGSEGSSKARVKRSSSGSSSSSSSSTPSQAAVIAYGVAVLGVSNMQLSDVLVAATGAMLQPAAAAAVALAAAAATSSDPGLQDSTAVVHELSGPPPAAGTAAAAVSSPADVGGWSPADVAQLMWGLATLGVLPPSSWLEDMAAVTAALMSRCQPSQLWGVLWGFAKMSHLPSDAWMASWLSASRQQLDTFTAEGLAHCLAALAALGHVPDKLWLRAACGMVAYKIRSFQGKELALVLPALSALGYKPRPELCRTIIAQVRRHLHTLKPSQLASVLMALASYPPAEGSPAGSTGWHPGRLFLFDFISHTQPEAVMRAWTGQQAAQVLWSFARCRYVPDPSYLRQLLAHLGSGLAQCPPDGLAMALWGLAALRQQLPSSSWAAAWCNAAQDCAESWGPQALAHGLSAMAALKMQPPAALMQALTRTASGCLSSFSCMELGLLIAGLADLHWRPSDTWMKAFVRQVAEQLPALENEDYGLVLFGLASLAQPLHPQLLSSFCQEAKRKLYGMSGEGLGLLVWGLAQYDYNMDDAEDWWSAVFQEFSDKWASVGLRGCALAVLGLAVQGPRHMPPGPWEAACISRYKELSTAQRPTSWTELLLGLRSAAGLEPGELLPVSPWLNNLLLQLGRAWNLPELQQGLAALVADVNRQVAAAAAAAAAGGAGAMAQANDGLLMLQPHDAQEPLGAFNGGNAAADSSSSGSSSSIVVVDGGGDVVLGQLPPDRGDVEPTSATAVLL